MDLLIDFECPECRRVQTLKVAELLPGRRPSCPVCGRVAELTEDGLRKLQRRLQEFCHCPGSGTGDAIKKTDQNP